MLSDLENSGENIQAEGRPHNFGTRRLLLLWAVCKENEEEHVNEDHLERSRNREFRIYC